MPWRRLWKAIALLSGIALAGMAVTAVPGSIALRDRPGDAEPWLVRCAEHQPRPDRLLLSRCVRMTGRVVAVRHEHKPDRTEVHLLVTARLHLFVVKLDEALRTPRLGSYMTFEGALVRARNGLREVDAWRVG